MTYYRTASALGRIIFPSLLWKMPAEKKELYLTFDDGPTQEITPWVLSLLKQYKAHATFFCIGENIEKNPEILAQILAEGHSVGNHSHNHLNGWKTPTLQYLQNVNLAEEAISKNLSAGSNNLKNGYELKLAENFCKIFRPPFGRIKPKQILELKKLGFTIVMWNVICGDFDKNLPSDKCFKNVTEVAKSGSIIVFHDSIKASANLKEVLPRVLKHYSEKGFKFKGL